MAIGGYLSKAYNGAKRQLGRPMASTLAHAGLASGTGAALGYLHGKYRERVDIAFPGGAKLPLNLVVGVGGLMGSLACNLAYGSRTGDGPGWCGAMNTVGNAALATYFFSESVSRGTKAGGHRTFVLPSGSKAPDPKAMEGLKETVVGAIPPAAVGTTWLKAQELQEIARG